MSSYKCNVCGAAAYYDGRMGDGAILMCGCDKKGIPYVDPRTGEAKVAPSPAKPVKDEEWR